MANQDSELDLSSLLRMVMKNWPLFLGSALICGGIGLLLAFVLPKEYKSEMAVIFPRESEKSLFSALDSLTTPSDEPRSFVPGIVPLRRPTSDYAKSVIGSRSALLHAVHKLKLREYFNVRSDEEAISRLKRRVTLYSKGNVLTVSARLKDPQLCCEVLNAFVEFYNDYTEGAVTSTAKSKRLFVEEQFSEYTASIKEFEGKVAAFQEKHAQVLAEAEPEVAARVLGDALEKHSQALAKLADAEAQLSHLKSRLVESSSRFASDPLLNPLPTEDPSMRFMEERLVSAKFTLDELRTFNTDSHPGVVGARESFAKLEHDLSQKALALETAHMDGTSLEVLEVETRLQGARSAVDVTRSILDGQLSKLSTYPSANITFQQMKRELRLSSSVYEMLGRELMSSKIQEAQETVKLELLDAPYVPDEPVGPRKTTYTIIGFGTGFLLAVVFLLGTSTYRSLQSASRSDDDNSGRT